MCVSYNQMIFETCLLPVLPLYTVQLAVNKQSTENQLELEKSQKRIKIHQLIVHL